MISAGEDRYQECYDEVESPVFDTTNTQAYGCEQTLEKYFVLLFIPQGYNYKVFNIEHFIEQLLVEKTIRYEIGWQSKLFILQ